jgi:predicted protein tyrosine phosphatase
MARKVLFVCTANIDRSPTAEGLLRHMNGFEVQSAGTWLHARRRITEELISWADIVFVMERYHKEFLLDLDPLAENKIVVLDIPDIYRRNDTELIRILKDKLSTHLNIEL